jgi:hypothetical protein
MTLNDRRDELRRMAQTQIEAIEAEAITEIERSCLEAHTHQSNGAVGKACRLMWRLVWSPASFKCLISLAVAAVAVKIYRGVYDPEHHVADRHSNGVPQVQTDRLCTRTELIPACGFRTGVPIDCGQLAACGGLAGRVRDRRLGEAEKATTGWTDKDKIGPPRSPGRRATDASSAWDAISAAAPRGAAFLRV